MRQARGPRIARREPRSNRSWWATGHLDDPCFPAANEDLRDRLRKRDHVLFLEPIRGVDPRERRQILEHMDEHVVLEARRDRHSFSILPPDDFYSPRFFFS